MADLAAPTVRAARPEDAGPLGAISGRAWEATYRGVVPDEALDEWIDTAEAGWRAALEADTPDGEGRRWVADREGVVLGYATTSPARDQWLPPPPDAGELTNLYLDPDVIGTGVGRLLYEHATDDLRARGFRTLVVWAFRDNARACRFYEARGLKMDVAEHSWVLAGVPCPIVRFRRDW